SATLWHAAATRTAVGAPAGSAAGRSVVVNGPATGAVDARPVVADALTAAARPVVAVAAGPTLPGAHEEAVAVAALHGVTPLTGAAATVDAVLAALGTADVVHLAAHGRLSADNPLFSDIRLADGPLVAYDVERLARVPGTVVLAACDTGRSAVRAGDELLGLSAMFLGRGTARLIASVLPVPDTETAPLMVALHAGLARGRSPATALAEAIAATVWAASGAASGGTDAAAALAAAAGFVCLGADPAQGRSSAG
ncbi:MAG TPA: CHAT domain-containing protein, partial [Pseudonocardiaceae bacterium]